MQTPVRQDAFDAHHRQWEQADATASAAERALSETLDGYCEGTGPPPPPEAGPEVRKLRQTASTAWGELLDDVEAARQDIDVL